MTVTDTVVDPQPSAVTLSVNPTSLDLKKGEKKTVTFCLTDEDFTYVDLNYKTVKLEGQYKIIVEALEYDVNI